MSRATRAAILAACVGLAGCPIWPHTLPHHHHHHDDRDDTYVPLPVTNLSQRLVAGDVVRIRTQKGKVHRFRITSVDAASFIGTGTNSKSYRVPYATIAEIWIRRL